VTITDNASGNQLLGSLGYQCVQPQYSNYWCTLSVCDFDNYQPNLPSIAMIQTGPPGSAGPACSIGTGTCVMTVPIQAPSFTSLNPVTIPGVTGPFSIPGTPGFYGLPGTPPDLTGTSKGGLFIGPNGPCYELNSSACSPMSYGVSVATTASINAALMNYYILGNLTPVTVPYTVNLPVITSAMVGQRACFRLNTVRTGFMSIYAPGAAHIDLNGVNTALGQAVQSGGALGDSLCVTAGSTLQYFADVLHGTWTVMPSDADSFVGTGALSAHADNDAFTWAIWGPRGTISPTLNGAGKVVASAGTTYPSMYNSFTPSIANYTVHADFTVAATPIFGGVYGRMSVGATTAYGAFNVAGTCTLYAANAGTFTVLGTSSCGWGVGATHTISLVMLGNQISEQVDGVVVIGPVTDSSISAAGKAGLEPGTSGTTLISNYVVE
jgi:hypothetical protein